MFSVNKTITSCMCLLLLANTSHKIGKFVNKLQFYERAYLPFQDTFELVPDYIDLNPQMLMQVISILSPLMEGMINQFIRCKMENAPQPIKYK